VTEKPDQDPDPMDPHRFVSLDPDPDLESRGGENLDPMPDPKSEFRPVWWNLNIIGNKRMGVRSQFQRHQKRRAFFTYACTCTSTPLSLKYNSTTEGQVSVSNSLSKCSVVSCFGRIGELDEKAFAYSYLRSALH
jgi:hypothetical protein